MSSFSRFRPRNPRFLAPKVLYAQFSKKLNPQNSGFGQNRSKKVPRVNFSLESVRSYKSYSKYQVSPFYPLPFTKNRIFRPSVFTKKHHFRIFSKYFFQKSITSSFFKISTWKFDQGVGISRIFNSYAISFPDFGL